MSNFELWIHVAARYTYCYPKKLKNVHENVFLTTKKVILKFAIKKKMQIVWESKSEPIHEDFMQNYVLSK